MSGAGRTSSNGGNSGLSGILGGGEGLSSEDECASGKLCVVGDDADDDDVGESPPSFLSFRSHIFLWCSIVVN